jgi:DNA-binding NtrC family response regulator
MSETPALPARSELLLLEDDLVLRRRLAARLRQQGVEVTEAGTLAEARRLAREVPFDFAALDLHLPDGSALEMLRASVLPETTCCVVMTAYGGVTEAVEAMRLGAADYLTKPFEPDELVLALQRGRRQGRAQRREEHQTAPSAEPLFFGESLASVRKQLDAILAAIRRLERQLPPVLIEGETGTGKTALARWLHQHGSRAEQPFIAINCAALPDTLAEAELFGHERGAFTDARRARIGLLEAADGGTILLDEVGTLAPAAQAKLLSAVESGTIRRLGANKEIAIDVHLLAAGNRPLADLVAEGAFREDLYHRLNLLHLHLPPLRERGSDVLALARHLLKPLAARHRLGEPTISPAGEARLLAHRWPGNIRELAHELERAVIFATGPVLEFAHLAEPGPGGNAAPWRNPAWRLPESGFELDQVIEALVQEALRETAGNVSAAARRLGVTREFLRYRLEGRSRLTGTAE